MHSCGPYGSGQGLAMECVTDPDAFKVDEVPTLIERLLT